MVAVAPVKPPNRWVAEIKAAGGDAIANGADVSNVTQVEAMVKEVMDTWGRIDVLINNAGILRATRASSR